MVKYSHLGATHCVPLQKHGLKQICKFIMWILYHKTMAKTYAFANTIRFLAQSAIAG